MTTAHTQERADAPVRHGSPRRPANPPSTWTKWKKRARHPVVAATVAAAVLHLVWALFLAAEGGDLAAQAAWTDFAW
ncbi:MFS transporter, partial [Micromonospora aurantiaca]|nr:MFS transporter [Micromonospora aurantiaca]